jgi:hypothetical protein
VPGARSAMEGATSMAEQIEQTCFVKKRRRLNKRNSARCCYLLKAFTVLQKGVSKQRNG